jgi:ferritin-like metal-binding protein YciE
MAMKSLDDLFVHMLRDIYYAEKAALRGMRQMSRKVQSDQLKQLLEEHREETEGQVETLEKAFEALGLRPRGVTCEAINGIIEEAKEIAEEAQEGPVRDVGIIAALQAVEHYEITRYGTAIAWAKHLGRDDVAEMLTQTLEQEIAADRKLTEVAEGTLNEEANTGERGDEEAGGQRGRGGRSGSQGGRGSRGGKGEGASMEMEAGDVDAEGSEDEESGGGRRGKKSKAA